MNDRTRLRCPVCRSAVPVNVLWAVGDVCPRCSTPLYMARRRAAPDGVVGKALALIRKDAATPSTGSGLVKTRLPSS